MIGIESKLTGNLESDLNNYVNKIQEEVIFSGVAAMAKVIYDEAQINAARHVKSGTLLGAIYRVYSKERSTSFVKTYQISWNKKKAPHGHLIEFGTSHAPAYPFLRPAFDHIQEAISAGKERMAERLDENKV